MDPPAGLRVEPASLVSQQEVALLVLGYLREEKLHFKKTYEAFMEESQTVLKGVTIQPNRQAKSLMRIVTEYVTLKQQEKDKLDMLRAFAGDSTSPLHRTVTSLVTLLDDYRTTRQAGIPLNANPIPRTVASVLPQHPIAVPEPSVVSHARVASPAPPPHIPVSPRGIPQPSTPSRVTSSIPPAPAASSLPTQSTAPGPAVPRRKAFRPRKIVLPVQPPLKAAPPLPAAVETPSDAGIAFVLRDSELQQKLAERITHHISTDHPTVAETLEPQPSEVLESILASLHDDPDMAHLFDLSDAGVANAGPKPAAAAVPKGGHHREQLEEFTFKAPKRHKTTSSAPPANQQSVDDFLNSLTYKPPPT